MADEVHTQNGVLNGNVSKNTQGKITFGQTWDRAKELKATKEQKALTAIDMAQSHFFKVQIDGFDRTMMQHNVQSWNFKDNAIVTRGYRHFLPVKNVSLSEVGVVTLNLPLGIFSDFPIAHRRKIGKLNITIVDTDDDWYEIELRKWYNKTVPDSNGYVGYMSEIIKRLTLKSYDTKGNENFTRYYSVMLTDDIQINRSYEANELKEISFNLAIVGNG